jgi:hypothetical protein
MTFDVIALFLCATIDRYSYKLQRPSEYGARVTARRIIAELNSAYENHLRSAASHIV